MSREAYEFKRRYPRVTSDMLHIANVIRTEEDEQQRKINRVYCAHLDAIGAPAAWEQQAARSVAMDRPSWAEKVPKRVENNA